MILQDLKTANRNILEELNDIKQDMNKFCERIKININNTVEEYPLHTEKNLKVAVNSDYKNKDSAVLALPGVSKVFLYTSLFAV